MIEIANSKKVLALLASETTNAATATADIDTLDYEAASIDVCLTTSDDATNNPSVLKLQESDTTDSTNFADIDGFVGDDDFTIPNAETAATNIDGPFATFNVDCRTRKRYLRVVTSPVTTQEVTVIAQLGRAKETPVTAAEVNANVVVNG